MITPAVSGWGDQEKIADDAEDEIKNVYHQGCFPGQPPVDRIISGLPYFAVFLLPPVTVLFDAVIGQQHFFLLKMPVLLDKIISEKMVKITHFTVGFLSDIPETFHRVGF